MHRYVQQHAMQFPSICLLVTAVGAPGPCPGEHPAMPLPARHPQPPLFNPLQVGISARPARQAITTLRPSPLLMLRSATPRFGAGPAPRSAASPGPSPPSLSLGASAGAVSSPAAALLPARENPHRLFIREPPPSTSASPSRSSLTPSTPVTGGAAGGGGATTPSPAAAAAGSGIPAGRPRSAERLSNGGATARDFKAAADGWVRVRVHSLAVR
jgi:hypothetical protein